MIILIIRQLNRSQLRDERINKLAEIYCDFSAMDNLKFHGFANTAFVIQGRHNIFASSNPHHIHIEYKFGRLCVHKIRT